jgi:PTH1 family peptidyl-tRNA hydrolase
VLGAGLAAPKPEAKAGALMKLVAGLGNPGEKYRGTRHNVGFEVVDAIAARHGLVFEDWKAVGHLADWRRPEERVLLLKPLSFMNLSGPALAAVRSFYKPDDLLIVCDDVNLPLGRLRARASGSEGGHNGLRSVAESLGTIDYARLRVGVGRGDMRRDLADHVLARFASDEMRGVDEAMTRAADAVEMWISDGLVKVMNLFNRGEDSVS